MVYKASTTTVVDNDFTSTRLATNVSVFTSPGTFTVPTGINVVHALIIGGGGGGGAGATRFVPPGPPADSPTPGFNIPYTGGGGGLGGAVYKESISVTPGASLTITRGTGGAGSNSTTGGAGNASSLVVGPSTYQANGGAGGGVATTNVNGTPGSPGTGSSGDINSTVSSVWNSPSWTSSSLGGFIPSGTLQLALLRLISQPTGTSSTTTTWSGIYQETISAGAGGGGESGANGNNAGSGKSGGVILIY